MWSIQYKKLEKKPQNDPNQRKKKGLIFNHKIRKNKK